MSRKSNPIHQLFILDHLVCRTPAFNLDDLLPHKFEELKEYIGHASPNFYELIKNLTSDELPYINKKIAFTLWKYFNRSKYRPIPFAEFAATTIIPLGISNLNMPVTLKNKLHPHHFRDWDEKESLPENNSKFLERQSSWFITNSTLYTIGQGYRYNNTINGHFEIGSINGFDELNFVLNYCLKKKSKADLYQKLQYKFNLNKSSITKLLVQLIECQLLWTDRNPNITGEDYFIRTGNSVSSKTPYIITERKLLKGIYYDPALKTVTELIGFLNKHLPIQPNNNLDNFRNNFVKKFGLRSIPISIALDPELGIGYANLETSYKTNEIYEFDEIFSKETIAQRNYLYNPLLLYVFNENVKKKTIRLEDFNAENDYDSPMLPNTFHVVYHQWKGAAVIEQIGGCTANALLGRFTLCGPEFEKLGKSIASIEQKANDSVIFFDVSYQAEKHVDNINRRKQLYENELPLFTWSTLPDPLHLNDIYVSVRNNEVILYSKSQGKRLVPRIPTAYNYNRSDFGVFMFLCDLQHQNLRTNLSFALMNYFPDLEHYVRVTYKGVIISPETWRLPEGIVSFATHSSTDEFEKQLCEWFNKQNINCCFKAGHNDQTLIFNPENKIDREAFAMYCRQNQGSAIYIAEALIDQENTIVNENGRSYSAQLIATLYHHGQIYKSNNSVSKSNDDIVFTSRHICAPGSDWLYFEIYCHSARSNQIFESGVCQFLKSNGNSIRKWFFIRFYENGAHLRLRLHLKKNEDGFRMIAALQQFLKDDLLMGTVSDIQIKTYFKEAERYGVDKIELVERFFWQDSRYVLSVLVKPHDLFKLYRIGLNTMRYFIKESFPEHLDQIHFADIIASNFSDEFGFSSNSYKVLNKQYELFKKDINSLEIYKSKINKLTKSKSLFLQIIKRCRNNEEKFSITADLLHMHINRLFAEDQRKHEAILYQYLLKDMKREKSVASFQEV